MRQLKEIKTAMTAAFIQNENVRLMYQLQPGKTFEEEFSAYSLENILFDVVAFSVWTLESLFYILKNQIDALILANKHGKLEWYIDTALNYQHGFQLDNFGDYVNGNATPEEIADSKIIAGVAFEKAVVNGHGIIRAKVVKEQDGEFVQLAPAELAGFHSYINKKTLFGLSVVSISRPHDTLRVNMKIWYDPTVIGANGARLDGTDPAPVVTAIKAYLKSLEFNGEFIGARLVDAVQAVQGVEVPRLLSAKAKPGQSSVSGLEMQEVEIEEIYQTFAGWMRLDVENSAFQYIAR